MLKFCDWKKKKVDVEYEIEDNWKVVCLNANHCPGNKNFLTKLFLHIFYTIFFC